MEKGASANDGSWVVCVRRFSLSLQPLLVFRLPCLFVFIAAGTSVNAVVRKNGILGQFESFERNDEGATISA
jgi:hypothetical protein